MRVVIDLKRGAKTKNIVALLYRQTHLQATFGAIMLALDDGVPRELNLKQMLERFRDFRLEVIRKRATFEAEKAKREAHIVEGLLTALDNIDAVIRIIRKAKDPDEASSKLQARFDLSDVQAKAILDMRLARLTALEVDELRKQLRELRKRIRDLEALLKSQARQLELLVSELDEIVAAHADERRTTILADSADYEVEDVEAEELVVITLSHAHYIKRVPVALYRRRASRGLAIAGMDRYEDDFLEHVFVASSSDTLLFFTDQGQAHAIDVRDVPEAGPTSRGRALAQLLTVEKGARVATLVSISNFEADRALLFLTANGIIKRTSLDQYANIRSGGIAAIKLQERDRVLDVQLAESGTDIVLVTRLGRAIRFPEAEVPSMGRATQGVKGVELRPGDAVIGMVVVRRDASICTVTSNGYAKRTPLAEYPIQKRGGLGTVTLDVTDRTGPLVTAKELLPGDELMVITAAGRTIRLTDTQVPEQGRATQGKRVLKGEEGDPVVEVARVAHEEDEESTSSRTRREQLELLE
jgi:DNA gyrase subunit A